MSDLLWIDGREVSAHPDARAAAYRKTATVLAAPAAADGLVRTPEGDMTFEAGDYLVTDDPPTHLWPVRREVFERTYALAAPSESPGSREALQAVARAIEFNDPDGSLEAIRAIVARVDRAYPVGYYCDVCPHAMPYHNPDGSCGCGVRCSEERARG